MDSSSIDKGIPFPARTVRRGGRRRSGAGPHPSASFPLAPLRWLAGGSTPGMGPGFRGARPHPNPSPIAMGEGLLTRKGAGNRGRSGDEATAVPPPYEIAMGEKLIWRRLAKTGDARGSGPSRTPPADSVRREADGAEGESGGRWKPVSRGRGESWRGGAADSDAGRSLGTPVSDWRCYSTVPELCQSELARNLGSSGNRLAPTPRLLLRRSDTNSPCRSNASHVRRGMSLTGTGPVAERELSAVVKDEFVRAISAHGG
jgi:hypothetical protein